MKMEPDVGIEPTTYRLQGDCTTAVLIRLKMAPKVGFEPTTYALTARRSAN